MHKCSYNDANKETNASDGCIDLESDSYFQEKNINERAQSYNFSHILIE